MPTLGLCSALDRLARMEVQLTPLTNAAADFLTEWELKLYFRDVKQPQDSDLYTVLFHKYCENYFYTNCLAEQPRANYFVSNLKMLLAPSLTCPLFQDKLFFVQN